MSKLSRRQTRSRRPVPEERQPWVHNERVAQAKMLRRFARAADEAARALVLFGAAAEDLDSIAFPYYDRYRRRISRGEYADLFEDASYRQVALDHHGDVVVSTVWLGIDHGFGTTRRPIIFETMVFGGEHDTHCVRYSSEDAALCGHMEIMERLLEEAKADQ